MCCDVEGCQGLLSFARRPVSLTEIQGGNSSLANTVLSYDRVFDLGAEPHSGPGAGRGILHVALLHIERPPVGGLGEALAVVWRGLVRGRAADVVVV